VHHAREPLTAAVVRSGNKRLRVGFSFCRILAFNLHARLINNKFQLQRLDAVASLSRSFEASLLTLTGSAGCTFRPSSQVCHDF